jgi:hypothetical protein
MSSSLKKLLNDYGIVGIIVCLAIAYGIYCLIMFLQNKGKSGSETMTQARNAAYSNSSTNNEVPVAAQETENGSFSSVDTSNGDQDAIPTSCTNNQNPADLLPKDSNSQWAQLNPVGKGDLANVNLLKAGYHIGIDTVGQNKRNLNLQVRSVPPNPRVNTGPWNQSTIEPDLMRPPLEIGQGSQ